MGLLDHFDALDRRFGLKRAPQPRAAGRGPWTLIAAVVPLMLEFEGLISTAAREYRRGIPAVLAVVGLIAALLAGLVLLWMPRGWALTALLATQGILAVRALYRGLVEGPSTRLLWLAVLATFVALLVAAPSRSYYRGEWRPRPRS